LAEIQNPNQQGGSGGGGSDSRSLFGFMIVFVLMVVAFQIWGPKKPQPEPEHKNQPTQTATNPAATPEPGAPVQAAAPDKPTAKGKAANRKAESAASVTVQAADATETVVENELYKIVFTNRGGEVKSWILKKFTNDDGGPLDLVNVDAAGKFGLPLSLYTYDPNLRSTLKSALYVPSATGTLTAPTALSFDYSAGGLTVHKTFRFDSSYVIHADVSVTQNGVPVTALLEWPAGLGDENTVQQYATANFVDLLNGKNEEIAAKKVSSGDTLHGSFEYAGVNDLYFAAVFMPDTPGDTSVVTLHDTVDVPKDRKAKGGAVEQEPLLGAAIGGMGDGVHTLLFVGPKSLDLLKSIHTANGVNLEGVVSFGWWGWIAKPMLVVLRYFVTHGIPNWGWAILVLTVLLNFAMLPTRVMMMKSSLKMQRIQPQIDSIKAKYAKYKTTDPRRQEMNQEMFDLQRKEGVNMFGGCLPMLLQYPLLFGFYRMLMYAIELRHAHWLWLPDLSAPDPLHILPVFVIVSMVLSQLFMPTPGVDQAQQRMMAFMMPVIFGVMMWNIGSGVALYWAGSNIIGVGQQVVMNRTSMGQEMRAIAAKRAAKKRNKGNSPGR
jgi:YidC/Oxa1 family membrane protein insertase